MGESLTFAKGVLGRTHGLLREVPAGAIEDTERYDIIARIKAVQDTLTLNERQIWLRAKEGKEMMGDLGVASTKLLGTIERLQRAGAPDQSLLKDLKAALGEVELHTKRINEETRKRGLI
jgi:hypothetical protein